MEAAILMLAKHSSVLLLRTYAFQKIRLPVLEPNEISEETQSLHQKNATELAELCRRQGGAWVKAAQFLSCQGDWLPETYVDQLAGASGSGSKRVMGRDRKTAIPVLWCRLEDYDSMTLSQYR
jgi:hypothetical protein